MGSAAVIARWRTPLAAAVDEVRRRPLHVAVAALVVGLVAAALLGGAVLADARLTALDHTALADRLGHAASVRMWLLEPARPRPFGGRTAVARLGDERVLVRTGARVRWPAA